MRIALGADHAGAALKNLLARLARELGHRVRDHGTNGSRPVDYPDYAAKVARAVASGEAERGIVVCGSGVGASIAANKIPGVRAGLCHDTYSARQSVEHDDANVLCLGSRVVGEALALEIARAFLSARFSGESRHQRRLDKVLAIERSYAGPRSRRGKNG